MHQDTVRRNAYCGAVSDPLFPVFCKLSKRHHVRCSGRLDAQVTALKLIGGYHLDVLYVLVAALLNCEVYM
jgi:hypothetical protein